jgi:ABC-2 type transport system ATP-binding protein
MSAAIVLAEGLSKRFRVADKQPGLAGTLRHALRRRYRTVEAVRDLNFRFSPVKWWGFWGPTAPAKPPR